VGSGNGSASSDRSSAHIDFSNGIRETSLF